MPEFDFSTFPILTTPRLILREIVPEDAADLFNMNSDSEVLKYDVDPVMQDVAEAARWIEKVRQHVAAKEALSWVVCFKQ